MVTPPLGEFTVKASANANPTNAVVNNATNHFFICYFPENFCRLCNPMKTGYIIRINVYLYLLVDIVFHKSKNTMNKSPPFE